MKFSFPFGNKFKYVFQNRLVLAERDRSKPVLVLDPFKREGTSAAATTVPQNGSSSEYIASCALFCAGHTKNM